MPCCINRLELDDDIVTFCDDDQANEICYMGDSYKILVSNMEKFLNMKNVKMFASTNFLF